MLALITSNGAAICKSNSRALSCTGMVLCHFALLAEKEEGVACLFLLVLRLFLVRGDT